MEKKNIEQNDKPLAKLDWNRISRAETNFYSTGERQTLSRKNVVRPEGEKGVMEGLRGLRNTMKRVKAMQRNNETDEV